MPERDEASRHKRILAEAKERFKLCQENDSEQRGLALGDLEFLDGQQWDSRVQSQRQSDSRPALVVNRMDQFVQHITNAMRKSRIAGRVFPVDDVADPDTAEVLQGHLRHIEYDSDGDLAYHTGAFYAVAMGWGVWYLELQYCSPLSFDVDIKIRRVRNPFTVYFDPFHEHPTAKDAKYGFRFAVMSKDEYKLEYPESDLTKGTDDWGYYSQECGDWVTKDGVRVAEYHVIESRPDTLVRLLDGSARLKSELGEDFDESQIAIDPKTGERVERKTAIETVKWYKLDGVQVLEETVWPTVPDYISIPLIKVVGNELDVNGKLKLKGIIRNLKDAQRQYNFMLSAQTEAIDSSKGQIILRDGQIEGHEKEWSEAARRKVLTIKDTLVDGKPAPDPGRLQPNMSIQSMTEARMMAADDLKALTGIYDAALGARSNETSGRAILSRQDQSDTANFHFTGNLVMSINHSSRLVLGAVPKTVDTARSIRVVGDDLAHKAVKVNQQFEQAGQQKKYDLSVGKYDVVCEAGPSPATKQEQDGLMMTELIKVAPGLMNIAPDLILQAVGAPLALVERVRKSLPPELRDGEEEQIPPEAMQKMQEMQQQLEHLNAYAQQKEQELKDEQVGKDVKLEQIASNERIAVQKLQMEAVKLDSQEAIALLKAEVDSIKAGMQLDAQKAAAEADAGAKEIAE